MPTIQKVDEARRRMIQAQTDAETAAAEYRDAVAEIVSHWRITQLCSTRRAAKKLGLAESSLRALLRPPGAARRK